MKASVGICAGFATTCLVRDEHVSCARDAMRGIAINMCMMCVCVNFKQGIQMQLFLQQRNFTHILPVSASISQALASQLVLLNSYTLKRLAIPVSDQS